MEAEAFVTLLLELSLDILFVVIDQGRIIVELSGRV